MLLQHLIRRQFTPIHWTNGSLAFRDGRVTGVKYQKPWVSGKVTAKKGTAGITSWDVTFKIFRDGIQSTKCSCAMPQCEHLAALVEMRREAELRDQVVPAELIVRTTTGPPAR